jgi:hypothetical protein
MLRWMAVAAVAMAVLAGCAWTERYPGEDEPVVTTDWGHRDLQMAAEVLANSVAQSGPARSAAIRPVVYFARVVNKTDQHIDTKNLTDRARVLMMKRNIFRFSAVNEAQDEMVEQLRFQRGPLVDPATRKELGRQVGADYFLFGELTSMTEKAAMQKGVYYKITLSLVNIETGIIEWSDDAEFQKVRTRGLFGG